MCERETETDLLSLWYNPAEKTLSDQVRDLPVSALMPLPCNQPSKEIRQSLKEASNYLTLFRVFNHIPGLSNIFLFDSISAAGTLWLVWLVLHVDSNKEMLPYCTLRE